MTDTHQYPSNDNTFSEQPPDPDINVDRLMRQPLADDELAHVDWVIEYRGANVGWDIRCDPATEVDLEDQQ